MNVVFVTLLDFDGYSAVVISGVKVQDDMSVDLLHMPKKRSQSTPGVNPDRDKAIKRFTKFVS